MKYKIYYKKNLSEILKNEYELKINSLMSNHTFTKKSLTYSNIVFSIGGDGTFLEALTKYGVDALYIPINAGTLGFYTSWNKENIDEITHKNTLIFAPLLEVILDEKKYYCINEMTIINPIATQFMNIYINGMHLENFRGTGICISTPTGSTAYNKSLGGAIIDYKKNLFQLVKMAPINNSKYRSIENPIILGEGDEIELPTYNKFLDSIMTIDRKNLKLKNIENIKIRLSNKKLNILASDDVFWLKIKEKFIKEDNDL